MQNPETGPHKGPSVEACAERRAWHSGYFYRAPRELRRSPYKPLRVLVAGACLTEPVADYINWTGFNSAEFVLFNHLAPLPPKTGEEIGALDFQIVQVPLRSVMPEGAYLRLEYTDVAAYEALFEQCVARLEMMFETVMRYNTEHGLLTFVYNFLTPQQNPMGRLFPKYDLRNPVYLVGELNRRLYDLIQTRKNAYLLDADEITATHGKRFYQDDSVWALSHGSILEHYDLGHDQDRMEPTAPVYDLYELRNHEYRAAVWHETVAMYESIRQSDAVKMVVIDLDDTLWRGELAEQGEVPGHLIEGWPLGFIEALLFLKRRGVVLGIISKNTEETVVRLWDGGVAGLIKLDDFAVRRINWTPKPDNMREILAETNLLPGNVVYIDDNPVQRAAMAEAFPEMRVLGQDLYYNRRILLWSPETQGVGVTQESARRTEMLQAQSRRENVRKVMSPEAFLASLELKLTFGRIRDDGDPAFQRCFELLNKTNQFNTTGKRWTLEEVQSFLRDDGVIVHASAKDRFTAYGVIFVALTRYQVIEQAVMSCRVAGMDVEQAALSVICDDIRSRYTGVIVGHAVETQVNLLSRDLFRRGGFEADADGGKWRLNRSLPPMPAHVQVVQRASAAL